MPLPRAWKLALSAMPMAQAHLQQKIQGRIRHHPESMDGRTTPERSAILCNPPEHNHQIPRGKTPDDRHQTMQDHQPPLRPHPRRTDRPDEITCPSVRRELKTDLFHFYPTLYPNTFDFHPTSTELLLLILIKINLSLLGFEILFHIE